jgi:nicotinamidase/pyrazinamidase
MKTVFVDVDNQLDFLYPAGALYVPGAELLVPAFTRLTQFAKSQQIQILSTADAHSEDDPEFKTWKPHCVAGTNGQQKATATLLGSPVQVIPSTPGSPTPTDAAQIVIEKQHTDCFTNPNLAPLLTKIAADRYVVYGVVTEICVSHALFGLLKTGARVELVTDAVRPLNEDSCKQMIKRFEAAGGVRTTVSAVSL